MLTVPSPFESPIVRAPPDVMLSRFLLVLHLQSQLFRKISGYLVHLLRYSIPTINRKPKTIVPSIER